MATLLSDEWFAEVCALAARLRDDAGGADVPVADCTVAVTTAAPKAAGGDVEWHVVIAAGAPIVAGAGSVPDADVALTVPRDDLVAMVRGELAPSVAFMQGRMKTAGDPGLLLDVLRVTALPGYEAARASLAATTDV